MERKMTLREFVSENKGLKPAAKKLGSNPSTLSRMLRGKTGAKGLVRTALEAFGIDADRLTK